MKGKVIVRIPERIYEFLEIHYSFETPQEEEEAIERARAQADKHNQQWGRKDHEQVIQGTRWRHIDKKWEYFDETKKAWVK